MNEDRTNCTHCGRNYWTDELERAERAGIGAGGPCPSDDCPARDISYAGPCSKGTDGRGTK
jgi:hypothetical protein